MTTLLLSLWIFLGLAIVLLYAPTLFIKGGSSRILALCLVCIGFIQLYLFSVIENIASDVLFYLHELALYPVAPLLFCFIQLLSGQTIHSHQWLKHLAPNALIFLMVIVQFLHPELKIVLETLIYTFSFLVGSLYARAVLKHLQHLAQPKGAMLIEAQLLKLTTVLGLVIVGLLITGQFLNHPLFFTLYGCATTSVLVIGHFIFLAYPTIDQIIADEIQDASDQQTDQNRKSYLTGIDIETSLKEVKRLLEVEGMYKRYDMTLPLLADASGLSPHQLSELINTQMGVNFSRFLKSYRIDEARRLLIEKPEMSVLDIGLSVGFSSLSAFYAAFRELEGMAPGHYRKQHTAR